MRRGRRGVIVSGVVTLGAVAGSVWLATAPTTTKQGVNFQVSSGEIPRYVKAVAFLHRHSQYRLVAEEITRGSETDAQRVLAVFDWTRRNIRPTPTDWPVVDDHILHIMIRGHGLDDQMADVFTTLSTYASVPAFWRMLKEPASEKMLVLSFANVEGTWVVFDVAHGLIFKDSQGNFLSAEAMSADPELVRLTAGALRPGGVPYVDYLADLSPFVIPHPLRAELQMPGPRLWYEVRKILGVE